MKKLFLSILMITSILFVGCTDLDDVNERLDDHDNRLNAIESLINDANNEITSIKALLDAQSKKISIVSYKELDDKSGYELIMSDGSKITLKNGKEGTTPLVNVKMHTDGHLYWTIDGEFMRDADGNMIKADGQDGQDGITPNLRVNTDGFWEVSLDNGKTWQLMLDVNGDPISAKGSDATVDLEITETDEAIIIIYDGQTYTIPKNSDVTEVLFKVEVPNIDDFNESYILKVLNANNEQIAEICLEYIKSDDVAKRMMTLYMSKDNEIDISTATTLEDGGKIVWDVEKFSCIYTPGSESDLKEVYISPNGLISFSNPSNADILETSLEAYLITDQRNEELNTYSVTKIGTQYWMAENLAYLPSVNMVADGSEDAAGSYYYVYGYDGTNVADAKATDNYATYGVLYNWTAAMDGEASSTTNPSGIQGVCPAGWHLPSDAEWTELTDYLGGASVAGGKLKETGTTHWNTPNTGATNETGFTALPGGYRNIDGTFYDIGNYGYWWSATEDGATSAWNRSMSNNSSNVYRGNYSKEVGFSVRCVRD